MARASVVSREAEHARQADLCRDEQLVTTVSAILFAADPIGISCAANTDEYDSEAESTVRRLHQAQHAADVQRIAHEEFVHWFDADAASPHTVTQQSPRPSGPPTPGRRERPLIRRNLSRRSQPVPPTWRPSHGRFDLL